MLAAGFGLLIVHGSQSRVNGRQSADGFVRAIVFSVERRTEVNEDAPVLPRRLALTDFLVQP